MDKETRVAGGSIAARAADGPRQFAGYAALFNTETRIGDWFIEVIAPGAFTASLAAGADVRALFNHKEDHVLGRTASGTLRLSEDARGLACEIDPPDTQIARDLATMVERGDVNQMSFAFRVTSEQWDDPPEPGALPKRTILACEISDVSIVTYPAYDDTEVSLRTREAAAARLKPDHRAVALASTESLRLRAAIAEASLKRSRNPAA